MTSTAVPAARTAPSADGRLRIAPPTIVHDVRVRAAAAVLAGEDVAEVAARHEVDTQTLLGWAERLARGGAASVTAEAPVVAEPEIPCDAGVTAPHVPVEDYLAVVAHEFRTPLTAARSGLWVLGRENVDPAVRAEVSGVVQERLGSLDRMCADVLDAVRVATGILPLSLDAVDAVAVLETACTPYGVTAPPAEPVLVRADGDRLGQVLTSLLSHVTRYCSADLLDVEVAAGPATALLTVRADGLVLTADELQGLFDPFGAAAGGDGNGLALYVVRTLVVALGGEVGVAPCADGLPATVFWVRLPRA